MWFGVVPPRGATNRGVEFGSAIRDELSTVLEIKLWECLYRWCGPRSSKPVGGVNNAPSGFDFHTLPFQEND